MTEYELGPKTKRVPARLVRVGHVVMESYEHPCTIVSIKNNQRHQLMFETRFIWQRKTEPAWRLGTFHPDTLLEKAI